MEINISTFKNLHHRFMLKKSAMHCAKFCLLFLKAEHAQFYIHFSSESVSWNIIRIQHTTTGHINISSWPIQSKLKMFFHQKQLPKLFQTTCYLNRSYLPIMLFLAMFTRGMWNHAKLPYQENICKLWHTKYGLVAN